MVPSELHFGDEPDLTEWALPNVRVRRYAHASDCCLEVVIPGEPVLVVKPGDIDPLTGEEPAAGMTTIYWSNGTITQSYGVDETDVEGTYLGKYGL